MTDKPTTKPALHVVVSGDTLSGIAKKYDVTLADILSWNAEVKDPNKISVGQAIKLAKDASQDQVYVIQPGDTVSALAKRFGKSWIDIQAYNHLEDVNLIIAGKKLIIPGGTVARGPETPPAG